MRSLNRITLGWFLAVAALLLAPPVLAQTAPDALVKSVAEDVLRIVRQDKQLREGDTSRMAQLIEEKIVPHFDFERMTRLAVGRNWREATPEQRKTLVDEFRTLLVRSYSAAYSTYNHIVVEVRPLKVQPDEEDVQVKSQIKLPGGAPPVNVDYSMVKNSDAWKVYDVSVDGVSRKGGIDGLIKSLKDLNTARAAPKPVGAKQ
jgi:phospholipid transport system substrate-binding protein